MQRVKHVVMGFVSMVCLAVGMNIGTPVGSHAQSDFENDVLNDLGELKNGQDALGSDHSNLEANQVMIKETLDAIEANQAKTHEWLTKIEEALGAMEGTQVGSSKCGGEESEGGLVELEEDIFCNENTGTIFFPIPGGPMPWNEVEKKCDELEIRFRRYIAMEALTSLLEKVFFNPMGITTIIPVIPDLGDPTLPITLEILKSFQPSIWLNEDSKNPNNARVLDFQHGTISSQYKKRNRNGACDVTPKKALTDEELEKVRDAISHVVELA